MKPFEATIITSVYIVFGAMANDYTNMLLIGILFVLANIWLEIPTKR